MKKNRKSDSRFLGISPDELLRLGKTELLPWQRDLVAKLSQARSPMVLLMPRRDPLKRLMWEVRQRLEP